MTSARVFDASAIVNLARRKRLDPLLEGHTLGLTLYEIGSYIWREVFVRRRLGLDDGVASLQILSRVYHAMGRHSINGEEVEALRMAVKEGLTFYDSAYLLTALRHNAELITDDAELYRKAGKYVTVKRSIEV